MVRMLIRHGICLSRLPRIHLSLRRLVVFLDINFLICVHSILDLIMPFFLVTCVIRLTILSIRVLIMHAMFNLILNHSGIVLMLS